MKNKKRLLMVGLMAFSMISIVVNSALTMELHITDDILSSFKEIVQEAKL